MQDLSETIENLYDISVDRISKIRFGYTNKKYLVKSKRNKYVARISSFDKINHLEFELHVLNLLQNYRLGFQVPQAIKTSTGTNFGVFESGQRAITLFKFIPGSQAYRLWDFPVDSKQISCDLGLKVGKLHLALLRINDHKTKLGPTHKQLVETYSHKFTKYESSIQSSRRKSFWGTLLIGEMKMIVDEVSKYADYLRKSQHSTSLVHTDLRLENMLARNGRIAAICDFDDILVGDQAYDVAKIFLEIYSNRESPPKRFEDFDIRGFKKFALEYMKTTEGNVGEFMPRVIDYLGLAALHVLSIVGRDPNFDNNVRARNTLWYSSFIEFTRNESNLGWLRSKLESCNL